MSTRARIIDAATELFAEKGVKSTSIAQIAETSGISKADIYHHFTGKDQVLVCVLDKAMDLLEEDILKAMKVTMEFGWKNENGEALLRYLRIISRIEKNALNTALTLVFSNTFYIQRLRDYILTVFLERHACFVSHCLNDIIESGQSRPFNVEIVSRILTHYMITAALKYITLYPGKGANIYKDLLRDHQYILASVISGRMQ
ncbi:TetR/AcrR family transcriptional regulator [Oscillospiraceae bacterium OttesenSCG-928-F05]|nr:TetR/AcrR family transcriptional regulator [Oscillospiraceae bacterium OttesenSCG-928-F05]